MEREELLKSKNYILAGMQLKLLNVIEDYMKSNDLKRNELAKILQVTKGYISQILNVSYDHKLSKVIDLALACGKVPMLFFVELDKFIKEDEKDNEFNLVPLPRCKGASYNYNEELTLNDENNQQSLTDLYLTRNNSYLQMKSDKSATQGVVISINTNDNSELRKIS